MDINSVQTEYFTPDTSPEPTVNSDTNVDTSTDIADIADTENIADTEDTEDTTDTVDITETATIKVETSDTVEITKNTEVMGPTKTTEITKPVSDVYKPTPRKLWIGTHNGYFHADEVLAVRLLKFVNDDCDIEVTRTRNQSLLDKMDIVVDVGRVYNTNRLRFDHHQSDCNETFYHYSKIPLSSAGMVYKHFGMDVVNKFFEENMGDDFVAKVQGSLLRREDLCYEVYIGMYKRFVQEIDANDNGVPMIKDDYKLDLCAYNYRQFLHHTNHIRNLNSDEPFNDEKQMEQFNKAMQLTWWVFSIHMKETFQYQYSYLQEKADVRTLFLNRTHPNILLLDKSYTTWRDHLKYLDSDQEIKFVVYPKCTEWSFSTMQVPGQRFTNQIDLLSEESLRERLTKPDELVFVHKNLFCGSAVSSDTALEVCTFSYNENRPRLIRKICSFVNNTYTNNSTNSYYTVFNKLLYSGSFLAIGYYLGKMIQS